MEGWVEEGGGKGSEKAKKKKEEEKGAEHREQACRHSRPLLRRAGP